MEFVIRSYRNLERLCLIDDCISSVWNNKFYSPGDFSIVCQTTPERLTNVKRDYFVTRDDIPEIGIIEEISYTKDEDNGAIMTISGRFGFALLGRRVIWDPILLNGNLISQVRNLINTQALTPSIEDRKLASLTQVINSIGMSVNRLPGAVVTLKEIVGGAYIDSLGVDAAYGQKSTPASCSWVTAGTAVSAEYSGGGTTAVALSQPLYGQPLTNARDSVSYNGSVWHRRENILYQSSLIDYLKSSINVRDIYKYSTYESNRQALTMALPSRVELVDQRPFTSHMQWLSKEQFQAGDFGISIFDNCINIRVFYSQSDYDNIYFHYAAYTVASVYVTSAGACAASIIWEMPDGYHKDLIRGNFIAERTSAITSDYPAINLPSDADIYRLEAAVRYSAYLSIDQKVSESSVSFQLQLGSYPVTDKLIFLQVSGENLEEKIESILKDAGYGVRAVYDPVANAIKIDIIEGIDRSKAQSINSYIVFSERLDNLKSYEYTANSDNAYNVARVLGKTKDSQGDEQEVWADVGGGAGITRRETFVNRSEDASYTGSSYTLQLQNEGKLNLNGFSVVISSEIEEMSYTYRSDYNVGDIVTIEISDLNAIFNVRILEVREYDESAGYSIDLVLGE